MFTLVVRHALSVLLVPFFLLAIAEMHAQSDSVLIQNSRQVNKNRYEDIDGSPYYFSGWVLGDVLRNDGQTVTNVPLNYNGFTHEMEIRSGDEVYSLDRRWHLRMVIYRDKNPDEAEHFPASQLIFQRGAHRDFSDRYSTILFLGENYTLIRDFDIHKVETEFNDVQRNGQMLRFKDQGAYYVKAGNTLTALRLQKKRISEAFDSDARITDFVAREKLDLNDEADLIRLVEYAESLR